LDRLNLEEIERPQTWQIALREYVRRIRDELREHIVKVILYGSYARGDYDEESDIDVMVVIDGIDGDTARLRLWDIAADVDLEYLCLIQIVVSTLDEYERKGEYSFNRNIRRDGVEV